MEAKTREATKSNEAETIGAPFTPVTIERILVAYDATPPSDRALEVGIRLAKSYSGTLTVLSVIPHHPGRMAGDPWDDEAAHERELDSARVMLREQGMKAEFLLRTGDVPRTIERTLAEGSFDTIVLGSRGLGTASRVLQGSVSEHVATHARATVIVVR